MAAEDPAIERDLEREYAELDREVERLRDEAQLSGPYDKRHAVVTIPAGLRGTDAAAWAGGCTASRSGTSACFGTSPRSDGVKVRRWSVETLLSSHLALGLDSNVLIYLLEDAGTHADLAGVIIDAVEDRRVDGVLASVGVAEILAGPARAPEVDRFERTADELGSMAMRIVPLTAEIASDAAWLREAGELGLADAVHLASARAAGATAFVTNDRRIRPLPGLEVVYLDDLVARS